MADETAKIAEKVGYKRPPVSTRFKPGPDPRRNTKGRPPGPSIREELDKIFAEMVDFKGTKKKRLNVACRKLLLTVPGIKEAFDRYEGKVTERHEITGADGGPLTFAALVEKSRNGDG